MLRTWPDSYFGRFALAFAACWAACLAAGLVLLATRGLDIPFATIGAFIMSTTFGLAKASTTKPAQPIWRSRKRHA